MSVLCARCETHFYTPYGVDRGPDDPFPPALSRLSRGEDDAPLWVCSECGRDEAMLEFFGAGAQPVEEWPVELQYTFTPVPPADS